jgi:hypothetical protein
MVVIVVVAVVVVVDDEAGRGRNNLRACFKMPWSLRLFRRAIMILCFQYSIMFAIHTHRTIVSCHYYHYNYGYGYNYVPAHEPLVVVAAALDEYAARVLERFAVVQLGPFAKGGTLPDQVFVKVHRSGAHLRSGHDDDETGMYIVGWIRFGRFSPSPSSPS